MQIEAPAERALGDVALRRPRRRERPDGAPRLDVVEHEGRAFHDALDLAPHGVAAAQQAPVEALGLRLGRAVEDVGAGGGGGAPPSREGCVKTRQPEVDAVVDPAAARRPAAWPAAKPSA